MANARIVTPEGRTSFMKVFKAEPNMNNTANVFSTKLLIPKSTNMTWITQAWKKLCQEEFGSATPSGLRPLFSKGNPFDDKGAIMDGDWKYNNVAEDKKEIYETYQDNWVVGLNAPEIKPPAVVDENKQDIINQADFQSGDYARCVIELSAYTSRKFRTPQISIRLVVIQKTRTGERFSGGMSTDAGKDMLDPLGGGNDVGGLL